MLSDDEMLKLEEFYHIFSFEPNFQVVAKIDGILFIIHPNENCGHNNGYVHIESSVPDLDCKSGGILQGSVKVFKGRK